MSERNDNINNSIESQAQEKTAVAERLLQDATPTGSSKLSEHLSAGKSHASLPEMALVASGMLVAPGMKPSDLADLVETAVDRIEQKLGSRDDSELKKSASKEGPELKVPAGAKSPENQGSLVGGGGSFQIPEDLMERLKKSKPMNLPNAEPEDLKQHSKEKIQNGIETVQKPERILSKNAKPVDLPNVTPEDLSRYSQEDIQNGMGIIGRISSENSKQSDISDGSEGSGETPRQAKHDDLVKLEIGGLTNMPKVNAEDLKRYSTEEIQKGMGIRGVINHK